MAFGPKPLEAKPSPQNLSDSPRLPTSKTHMKTKSILSRISFALFLFPLLQSCSSTESKPSNNPKPPDWISQPTRLVDNGYIVYVESESGPSSDKATLKAEGLALSDLANECSLIPKGTRIEDRYLEPGKYGPTAFVKLAVEFQDCTAGQKANDADSIRKIANASFTQRLKEYQDYLETGEISNQSKELEVDLTQPVPPLPQQNSSSQIHFYAVRQYISYQKEYVVLAPATAFAPNSPESLRLGSAIAPANQQLHTLQTVEPQLQEKQIAWSKLPDQPKVQRPSYLKPPATRTKTLSIPRVDKLKSASGQSNKGRGKNGGKSFQKAKRKKLDETEK